jgi:hypothetical protein
MLQNADDTQLYLSFSAAGFSRNITLLETAISNEFLVIGLPQQLSI